MKPLAQRRQTHIVVVEVGECAAGVRQALAEARGVEQVLDVAAVARALADRTSAAPARRDATAAPATTSGCVLIAVPGSYSTMFGLSSTRCPAQVDAELAESRGR